MKNIVFRRRSVRTYQDEEVPKDVIESLLRAAMQAPSAHNQQPWQYVVVRKKEVIEELAEAGPHAVMLKNSPLAIVLLADPDEFVMEHFWPQDLAASATTLLLQAVDQGYGGCWIGVYPEEDKMEHAKTVLGIKSDLIPFAILSLGKPRKEVIPRDCYDEGKIQWIE